MPSISIKYEKTGIGLLIFYQKLIRLVQVFSGQYCFSETLPNYEILAKGSCTLMQNVRDQQSTKILILTHKTSCIQGFGF